MPSDTGHRTTPSPRVYQAAFLVVSPPACEGSGLRLILSCIADAQSIESYASHLLSAGLDVRTIENHNAALIQLVHQIRIKLLSAEVLVGLKKLALPNVDFTSAKQMAVSALAAVDQGQLGYAVLIAAKPTLPPSNPTS